MYQEKKSVSLHYMWDDPFFVRNVVYGLQDSLFSTTGVVVGTSLAGLSHREVIVTGLILVLVEALSMSFGAFVSEESFTKKASIEKTPWEVSQYAIAMLVSYLLAGIVPLLPFIFKMENAWKYSIGLALACIFALIYTIERSPGKASLLTGIGAAIMGASIGAGQALKM